MSGLQRAIKQWDVARFLRRQGFEVHTTEGGEVHIQCPRCHDSKYRLYVNRRTKNWICHNCGGKGRSAVAFLKWILRVDDASAVRTLAQSGSVVRLDEDDEEDERPVKKPTRFKEVALPPGYQPLSLPATEKSGPFWDYLIERKISPKMVYNYKMGYCRVGPYKWRIIIPVTMFGKRHGYVARTIREGVKRKYLNPDEMHTSRVLFNLDNVLDSGTDKVVLVEGVFDALRLPDLAVCTFGKKISHEQMDLLAEAGFKKLVFCYDGDALRDSSRYAASVPSYMACYRATLPPEYDPGNAPLTVLSQAIRAAKPFDLCNIRCD